MSVNNREIEREREVETENLKICHVSDASTELHEKNVYLALIVCTVCLLQYPNVSLDYITLNVSLCCTCGSVVDQDERKLSLNVRLECVHDCTGLVLNIVTHTPEYCWGVFLFDNL